MNSNAEIDHERLKFAYFDASRQVKYDGGRIIMVGTLVTIEVVH